MEGSQSYKPVFGPSYVVGGICGRPARLEDLTLIREAQSRDTEACKSIQTKGKVVST